MNPTAPEAQKAPKPLMRYFPTHLQIETVNRICNARCPMCSIQFIPDFGSTTPDKDSYLGVAREPGVMSLEAFKVIASKFKPILAHIKIMSLHGCGEPLLDNTLHEKIRFAKEVGFREVGFTSNCNALRQDVAVRLLEAGLNCIIPSIDGITKEVHEEIRPRTNYEQVVDNVKRFIAYRDKHDFKCKVLIRMVRQQLNYHQWDEYRRFWSEVLRPEKGDSILGIDVHNIGGRIAGFEKMKVDDFAVKKSEYNRRYIAENADMCPDLFSRLSIFVSGDVALCSADQSSYFKLGNVLENDPIDIFNNEIFTRYRDVWIGKKYMELEHCKNCTIAISRATKTLS